VASHSPRHSTTSTKQITLRTTRLAPGHLSEPGCLFITFPLFACVRSFMSVRSASINYSLCRWADTRAKQRSSRTWTAVSEPLACVLPPSPLTRSHVTGKILKPLCPVEFQFYSVLAKLASSDHEGKLLLRFKRDLYRASPYTASASVIDSLQGLE
jgi:hypothetical protein